MPGKSAPKNETKEQRFVRLANIRADNAMKAIEGIGKLVGPQYGSTKEQHDKLIGAIRYKLEHAAKSLAENKASARTREGVL